MLFMCASPDVETALSYTHTKPHVRVPMAWAILEGAASQVAGGQEKFKKDYKMNSGPQSRFNLHAHDAPMSKVNPWHVPKDQFGPSKSLEEKHQSYC